MRNKDQSDRSDRVRTSPDNLLGFATKGGARFGVFIGFLLVIALQPSCSKESVAPSPAAATPPPTSEVNAYITVVDSDGHALVGMIPLVTRRPNAFDEPVATGAPTGVDGKGSVRFTSDVKVYLRAWDPMLERFPNNYYDVLPGSGNVSDDLEIVMLDAVTLKASLLTPTGVPAVDESVALMLLHPGRGPWWPTKGRTDSTGGLALPNLPPGKFSLRFETGSGYRLELPEVGMLPGHTVDLGVIELQ